MHDIHELETKWRQYRRKKWIPYALGSVTLAIGLGLGLWLYASGRLPKLAIGQSHRSSVENNSTSPSSKKQDAFVYQWIKNDTIDTLAKKTVAVHAPAEEDNSPLSAAIVPVAAEEKRKKIVIEVVDTNSRRKLKAIEKRFKMAHDPEDSLFLAKRYLAMQQYKKAEYWALQTNRLDEEIEDSWLIFAIAKAKQGKRNEALKVLQAYIEKTDSRHAKQLYGSIKARKKLPLRW